MEEKEDKIKKKLLKHPSVIKKFISIYNNLCQACRNQCIADPARPMSEYCSQCQQKITPILEKIKDKVSR